MDEYVTKKEFIELKREIASIKLFDEEHMKILIITILISLSISIFIGHFIYVGEN